jgi:hypothetical protein
LTRALTLFVALAASAQTGFQDFAARVDTYMALRKTVQGSLPPEKPTRKRKQIVQRQAALAQKIRDARSSAKQGDIFTPQISSQFRQIVHNAFTGPNARYVRKTIREGAPLKGWTLSVNADYPEHLPLTTVPPTLLLNFPELPRNLEYHIVGRDLILLDIEARMVIDFIPGALP